MQRWFRLESRLEVRNDHVLNCAVFIMRGCETPGGQIMITRAIYGALLCAFTAAAVEPGLPRCALQSASGEGQQSYDLSRVRRQAGAVCFVRWLQRRVLL